MPSCASELSLWLGARLPLTTSLRVSVLSTLCPLRRMQDCVDALRLLLDPHRPNRTQSHRFKLIVDSPATDNCSTVYSGLPPRMAVAEAPPSFTSWADSSSFPHG